MADSSPLKMRCSMLPGFADCARRAVAKQYRRQVEERGFSIRQLPPSIGAAVGTAVHAAAAEILKREWSTGGTALDHAVETASIEFNAEVSKGVIWDDTTPNSQAAKKQIESLTQAFISASLNSAPVLIEERFSAKLSEDWEISGQIDTFENYGHLDDLKTGALARPYIQQLGGYAMLLETNGHRVSSIGTTFIKRVPAKRDQPAAIKTRFDLTVAKKSAWVAILEIQRVVGLFLESGDPYSIAANPMSMMCSDKYCPAHSTEFCKVHMGAK